jgi:hypothetical protein
MNECRGDIQKIMNLYEECETCNINKIKMYCMIIDNKDYKEISLSCPCRECLLKTNCNEICQSRLDVWGNRRRLMKRNSIL